jgi:hypothetical protein
MVTEHSCNMERWALITAEEEEIPYFRSSARSIPAVICELDCQDAVSGSPTTRFAP